MQRPAATWRRSNGEEEAIENSIPSTQSRGWIDRSPQTAVTDTVINNLLPNTGTRCKWCAVLVYEKLSLCLKIVHLKSYIPDAAILKLAYTGKVLEIILCEKQCHNFVQSVKIYFG